MHSAKVLKTAERVGVRLAYMHLRVTSKEVLKGCNFEFNSDKLLPGCEKILDEVVRVLKANPDVNVEIQGHTDNVGSVAYNQKLSTARASSVKQYLVDHGVNSARLKAVGKGEVEPVADNTSEAGRLQNRRVELHRLN